jgi:hypothetical protein
MSGWVASHRAGLVPAFRVARRLQWWPPGVWLRIYAPIDRGEACDAIRSLVEEERPWNEAGRYRWRRPFIGREVSGGFECEPAPRRHSRRRTGTAVRVHLEWHKRGTRVYVRITPPVYVWLLSALFTVVLASRIGWHALIFGLIWLAFSSLWMVDEIAKIRRTLVQALDAASRTANSDGE